MVKINKDTNELYNRLTPSTKIYNLEKEIYASKNLEIVAKLMTIYNTVKNIENQLSSLFKCPICNKKIKSSIILKCGHSICKKCSQVLYKY